LVGDRAAFFLDLDLERDAFGQTSPATGTDAAGVRDSAVGIRYARAVRFEQILHDQHGVEPGIIVATPNRVPCGNLFARITFSLR
jgi:hypothetical protein